MATALKKPKRTASSLKIASTGPEDKSVCNRIIGNGIPKKTVSADDPKWAALAKKYGAMTASEDRQVQADKPVYSTGSLGLDLAIGKIDPIFGNGGIPARSIVEIFGPNGVGKSMLFEHLIKSVQKRGKRVVVLYTEAPDYERMERIGIDLDKLIILKAYEPYKTASGEKKKVMSFDARVLLAERKLNQLIAYGRDEEVGMIGIDSLKGLTSAMQIFTKGDQAKGEDRKFEESETAVRANLIEKFFNRAKIHVKTAMIIMVNQLNEAITKEYMMGMEARPKTSGGRRKEFECLLRIEIASRPIYDDEHDIFPYKPQIGLSVYYWLIKNRYSQNTGARRVVSDFIYDKQRFDISKEVVKYGAYLGHITSRGNWFYFNVKDPKTGEIKEKGFNGAARAAKFLDCNSKLRRKLIKKITAESNRLFARKSKEKKKAKFILADSDDD